MPGIEQARVITGYYDVTGYGWIIDTDHLYDPTDPEVASDKDTMGPARISEETTNRLVSGEGKPFQMYDDDGELYYTGRIIVPPGEEDGELLFRPLSDFGEGNAGCTEIRYQNDKGEWKTL